jgi:hypothetical protein
MNDYLENLPDFWQGVLASITAGILLAIAVAAGRASSGSVRTWFRGRRERLSRLRGMLQQGNDLTKTHASLILIFNTLKWILLGNILWVAPDALDVLGLYPVFIICQMASLICFCLGLRWVSFFVSEMRW